MGQDQLAPPLPLQQGMAAQAPGVAQNWQAQSFQPYPGYAPQFQQPAPQLYHHSPYAVSFTFIRLAVFLCVNEDGLL
jgi:hypothetical protein